MNQINRGRDINFKLVEYSSKYYDTVKKFKCGNSVIDDYIVNKAKDDIGTVTYLVINADIPEVIGFISLSCSGIKHNFCADSGYSVSETKAAIEIKYFAIASKFHKLLYDDSDEHFYFSDMVFCEALKKCRYISENIIGAEYIMLYSVDTAKRFYKRNLFETFTEYMSRDNINFLEGCTPMYICL